MYKIISFLKFIRNVISNIFTWKVWSSRGYTFGGMINYEWTNFHKRNEWWYKNC